MGVDVASGQITGTTTAMQYSLNSTNGTNGTWIDASATNTPVTFSAGSVYVRQKAAPTNYRLVATIAASATAPTGDSLAKGTDVGTTKIGTVETTEQYRVTNADGSLVKVDWTTGTGAAVDNLAVNNGDKIEIRVKATATTLASAAEPLTVNKATDIKEPAVTAYTINYIAGTTTQAIPTTVEYSTDNFVTAGTLGTDAALNLTPGTDVYFRVAATADQPAGAIQTLTVKAAQALGTITTAGQTATEDILVGDVAITTADGYEYQQDGGNWTPITTSTQFDLSGDTTFKVRKAATATDFASVQSADLDTVAGIVSPGFGTRGENPDFHYFAVPTGLHFSSDSSTVPSDTDIKNQLNVTISNPNLTIKWIKYTFTETTLEIRVDNTNVQNNDTIKLNINQFEDANGNDYSGYLIMKYNSTSSLWEASVSAQ